MIALLRGTLKGFHIPEIIDYNSTSSEEEFGTTLIMTGIYTEESLVPGATFEIIIFSTATGAFQVTFLDINSSAIERDGWKIIKESLAY